MILGNHDRGRVTSGQFVRLGFFYPVRMYQFREFILTHEPLNMTNLLYLEDQGIHANVHGHLHLRDEGLDHNKYCCVSVERINYRPISYEEIKLRLL